MSVRADRCALGLGGTGIIKTYDSVLNGTIW
jgi:hypothetical protein